MSAPCHAAARAEEREEMSDYWGNRAFYHFRDGLTQGQRDERERVAAVEAEKDAAMADAINEGTLINGAALSAFRLSLAAIRAREEKPHD